jgi:Methane oxygenase PmoA
MKRHSITICGILAALAAAHTPPAVGGSVSAETRGNEWVVTSGADTLCVYRFDPAAPKPYVSVLATTRGDNLLRDSPFDHKHHHALMYAVAVNGNNFWEEAPGHGVERHAGGVQKSTATLADGRSTATFRHRVLWLTSDVAAASIAEPPALLEETRTITLTVDDKAREVALGWKSEFALGSKAAEVTISGSEYFGLGVRFLQDLDPVSSPMIGATVVEGDRLVAPGPFGAMRFDAPGRPATIALFASPTNAKSPATFFTMRRKPFAYLAATQALDKAPLKYKAGDRFTVEYLVVTYPMIKPAVELDQRGNLWVARTSAFK